MKEQIWLTNVEFFSLLVNTSCGLLLFCIDTHVCTVSKGISINKEIKMCQTRDTLVVIDEKE